LVSLPVFHIGDKQIELPKEIERQAYSCYYDDFQVYCFRVTEKQYKRITGDYFAALESGTEKSDEVAFKYDELFAFD